MTAMRIALCLALGVLAVTPALAQESSVQSEASCASPDNFAPDSRYQQIAEAYSLDALDVAQQNFGISLDWSEASISQVEEMLTQMHDEMKSANPPPR